MIKLIYSEAVEARLLNNQDLDKSNPSVTKRTHKTSENVIYSVSFIVIRKFSHRISYEFDICFFH